MKLLILLLAALAYASASTPSFATMQAMRFFGGGNRIIDGQPAVVGQFPWQVAVTYSSGGGNYFCGGSLISDQWVLTAAHCAQNIQLYTLHFGGLTHQGTESGRVTVTTTEYYPHPGYNSNLNNDVALIKLPSPIQLNDRIQPVRLPARGNRLPDGSSVTVSGWGKTTDVSGVSSTLNFVGVTSIPNADCAAVYGNAVVISSTVCVKGNPNHGTCNGDSGGPLVQGAGASATQVGVVSFGHISGCQNTYPNGFVRTESQLDWIASTTGLPV